MFMKNNVESKESTSEYLRIQERDDSSVQSAAILLFSHNAAGCHGSKKGSSQQIIFAVYTYFIYAFPF